MLGCGESNRRREARTETIVSVSQPPVMPATEGDSVKRDDKPTPAFWEASWPAQVLFGIVGLILGVWAARQWGWWVLLVFFGVAGWAEWVIWRWKRDRRE